MDFLGVSYIIILLVIIFYSNFIFFKGIRNIEKKHLGHKLFYFLMSLVFPSIIIFLLAVLLSSSSLLKLFNWNIDYASIIYRIIIGCIIFPPSILVNIYFARIYLKRISKTKNKNEIELIGKE
ncbi:hypothetical protein DCO46_04550 [Flavobacterium sp. HTF]|nr:hypothetical protein DCO46_04550 [Flavobacterium sp. HTF]